MKLYGQDIYKFNDEGYAYDIMDESEMILHDNYDRQVCIYVAKKSEKR